jgi:hypothetical protein
MKMVCSIIQFGGKIVNSPFLITVISDQWSVVSGQVLGIRF